MLISTFYSAFMVNINNIVSRFEETPEGMDIDTGAADQEDMGHKFSNGDNVLVVEGELQNLQVQFSRTP